MLIAAVTATPWGLGGALPAFATIIGAAVLRQIPTVQDVAGITLVVLGVAIHQVSKETKERT